MAQTSTIHDSALWLVKYALSAGERTQYISLNADAIEPTPDVLGAIGFILFVHEGKQKCQIIETKYLGKCLH